MQQERARVVVRLGAQPEQVYLLDADQTSLGRDSANDIIIGDYEVSRRHARILYRDGTYRIEDLGSTNGTFVNGYRLAGQVQLVHGDKIELGQSVGIVFLWEEPPAETDSAESDALPDPPVVESVASAASVEDDPPESADEPAEGDVPAEEDIPAEEDAPTEEEIPAPESPPPDPGPDPEPRAAEPAAATPAATEPELLAIPRFDPIEYARGNFEAVSDDIADSEIAERAGCARYLVGFGCVVIVLAVALVLLFLLLDAFAPDFLYCGPLRSLWDTLNPVLNVFDRQNVCP